LGCVQRFLLRYAIQARQDGWLHHQGRQGSPQPLHHQGQPEDAGSQAQGWSPLQGGVVSTPNTKGYGDYSS